MRNTLTDMHNLLMEEMERLACAEGDELEPEIGRAAAMSGMAKSVVDNAKTIIGAARMQAAAQVALPRMITGRSDGE